MTTIRARIICPSCGSAIPADAPRGVCPRCILALGGDDSASAGNEQPKNNPAAALSPEELGAQLPDFEVLELIGRGGMGAVYKARQPRLNRFVAIKVLYGMEEASDMFRKRFEREAQSLAALNHPNIITIHDFGVAQGVYYIVMEYVDGVSLRELIRSVQVQPREVLGMIPQICEALQYAHDQGFVHRDIKPGNILINRQGRVKIADFGLAKLLGGEAPHGAESVPPAADLQPDPSLTQAGQLMGTPQYMAPEQREHPLSVDHRADIYSLGVVFYEMLTGELPQKDLVPPSRKVHVDVRIDEVVLRAMDREPDRRYQHASDIKMRVDEVRKESEEPRAIRQSFLRRHPILSAGAAISGLLLVVWPALRPGGEAPVPPPPAEPAHTADLFAAALKADTESVRWLLRNGADVRQRDAIGNTPLMLAALAGAYDCFKLLADAGADLKATNHADETALDLAASGGRLESGVSVPHAASDEEYSKVMTHLLNEGADINAWTTTGRMPIHYAVFGGRTALVDLLLKRGAFLVIPDRRGNSPFLDAARGGSTGVVAYLLCRGFSPRTAERGITALHWAAANNDLPMAEFLANQQANLNAQDTRSETPLHWAAQRGHLETAGYLVANGANTESRNVDYQTPLHLAVQSNSLSVVKLLCERGANVTARALDARTPLDMARDLGREEIVKYLEACDEKRTGEKGESAQ
jgi:serine/threonine protein kinase/ankyrin repeat protein